MVDVQNDFPKKYLPNIQEEYKNGQYRLSETLLFTGTIKNGVPDGEGRIVDLKTNMCIYEGYIKNKLYNGMGKLYHNNLLFEEGLFENGLIKEGIRYNPDKSLYNGEFSNNQPHGKGTIVFPNGFFYETTWVMGIPNTLATVGYPNASSPSSHQLSFHNDSVEFIERDIRYVLYSNGDIAVGMGSISIENGHFYKFNSQNFSFMKMQIGVGCVSGKQPTLLVTRDIPDKVYIQLRFN